MKLTVAARFSGSAARAGVARAARARRRRAGVVEGRLTRVRRAFVQVDHDRTYQFDPALVQCFDFRGDALTCGRWWASATWIAPASRCAAPTSSASKSSNCSSNRGCNMNFLPALPSAQSSHRALVAGAVFGSASGAPVALQDVPLYLLSRADPNVLINMSVETPMGGAAYTDHVGVPRAAPAASTSAATASAPATSRRTSTSATSIPRSVTPTRRPSSTRRALRGDAQPHLLGRSGAATS